MSHGGSPRPKLKESDLVSSEVDIVDPLQDCNLIENDGFSKEYSCRSEDVDTRNVRSSMSQ